LAEAQKMRYKCAMSRIQKALLLCTVLLIVAGAAASYNFFIGFPTKFEGRWVHRVTVWSPESRLRPERIYFAYTGADGNEIRHGTFQRFDNGRLVQQTTYRNGKLDGPITYWNVFGEKTQEVYYRDGTPFGVANFAQGKLVNLRQEVFENGRGVAIKTFDHDRYSLQFKCGELVDVSIDPNSGQLSPIPNAAHHACVEP